MYRATKIHPVKIPGKHPVYTCDRCGHESRRRHPSGLCVDCRWVDPKVWERAS